MTVRAGGSGGNPDYERERIEIERDRLELDRENARAERRGAAWTRVSIVATVLVAAVSLAVQSWLQHDQQRAEIEAAAVQRKSDFALEAARVVFAAQTCEIAVERATMLVKIFGGLLPGDFVRVVRDASVETFVPGPIFTLTPTTGSQTFLARILDANRQAKPRIVTLDQWKKLKFPSVTSRTRPSITNFVQNRTTYLNTYFVPQGGVQVRRETRCGQFARERARASG